MTEKTEPVNLCQWLLIDQDLRRSEEGERLGGVTSGEYMSTLTQVPTNKPFTRRTTFHSLTIRIVLR